MPTNTLERKISIGNFFQNSDEISDALNRVNEKSEQALQKSDSALARAFSNENYLQSLLQTISTQNESISNVVTENKSQSTIINNNTTEITKINQEVTNEIVKIKRDDTNQTQELSKAFGILRGLYDSLGSAVQSLRSDVESISKYLLDEQRQRQQQLEQREYRIARQKDLQEKSGIIASLRKSMQTTVGDTAGREGDLPRPGGEESFFKNLLQGALSAAGIAVGTTLGGTPQDTSPDTPAPSSGGVSGNVGQWGPLLQLIASKESGGNYEAMYPSTTLPGATKMTISEVARKATGAVGKYQQKPEYLVSRAKAAGLNPDKDLYSPENQDLIAAKVNIGMNRGGNQWLQGKITDEQFMQGLSQEFAVLPNAQGKFYHDGQGSSITPQQVKNTLQQVKGGGQTAKPQQSQTSQAVTPTIGGEQTSQAVTPTIGGEQTSQTAAPVGMTQASQEMTADGVKPEMPMKSPSGDASAPFIGQVQSEKQAEAQPSMTKMDTSSIVPFDYQPVQQMADAGAAAGGGYAQGVQSNISTTPDHPDAIPTNNPLTRMWTMSAINHLNINASMHHIYG